MERFCVISVHLFVVRILFVVSSCLYSTLLSIHEQGMVEDVIPALEGGGSEVQGYLELHDPVSKERSRKQGR